MTCAVHCVISSLVALVPALGVTGAGLGAAMEWLELPLLVGALGLGLCALVPAWLRGHRNPLPMSLFLPGIALVLLGRVVPSMLETPLTVAGVAFIASAHVANLRAHAALHRARVAHAH